MTQEFEDKVSAIKEDKNRRITEINQRLLIEQENAKACMDKARQMAAYIRSAKKLLKLKKDEGLSKF